MRLIFDLDGTLTDPFKGITSCIQHALGGMGITPPHADDLRWCIGPPLHESFMVLLKTTDESAATEAVGLYRERFGTVGLFENKVYPEIVDCLIQLRDEGHELSIATSKPRVFAKRIIEHFELTEYFSVVDGSELDGTRCDKTSLLAYILERDQVDRDEAVMIGDRKFDMDGATANGIPGIGVLWGYGTIDELREAGASQCAESPSQLPAAIKQAMS